MKVLRWPLLFRKFYETVTSLNEDFFLLPICSEFSIFFSVESRLAKIVKSRLVGSPSFELWRPTLLSATFSRDCHKATYLIS